MNITKMKTENKKSTRLLSGILVFMLAFSSITSLMTVSASADEIFQCTLNEDFEDDDLNYQVGGGTNASDYVSIADLTDGNLLYGKALKMDLSKAGVAEYKYDIKTSANAHSYVGSDHTNYANYYSETSFDITPIIAGRPIYVYLMNGDTGAVFTTLHWSNDGKSFYVQGSGSLQKVGTYTNGQMMNVKVVQHWTDKDKNGIYQTTGVYVNGSLVDTTNLSFPSSFDQAPGKFSVIRLFCAQRTANQANGIIIDNVNCVRYTSADGTSPVADFSKLKAEITTDSGLLSNTNYSEGDRAKFKQEILKAVKVCNNIMSSQTQVNNALAELLDAKSELKLLNQTPQIYEDFEDDTYTNLNSSSNLNGTVDSTTYAGKFYGKVFNYAQTSTNGLMEYINTQKLNADQSEHYVISSLDFKAYGIKDIGKNVYLFFGNEGSQYRHSIRFTISSKGELSVGTLFGNKEKIYISGNKTPLTDTLTIAKDIDLDRMHNLKLVLYKNPNPSYDGIENLYTPEIVGIYLDGKKLDLVDNSEQTIYPIHSPAARTNYIRVTASNDSTSENYGKYGILIDNITSIRTTGTRPVEKELLKSAITEAYYVYDGLTDEKKELVTNKLAEAEELYKNGAAGQTECDNMAKQLNNLLLPSLDTYLGRVSIPSVISANEIVLPSFDDGVTTTTVTSDNESVITNDGKVIQPTDKAVQVNITVKLSREGETPATKVIPVTVMPKMAVEINSVKYTDADNNTVYGPVNNGKLSTINVVKNTEQNAKIVAAVYDDEALDNVKIIDALNGECNVDLALDADGAKKSVKFFVWSDFSEIKPLQSTVEHTGAASVYVLADSIYAEKPENVIPAGQVGIGKVLKENYGSAITINNLAWCGTSTKSFADSYMLNSALNDIKPGDYAIISFAHNDEKSYTPGGYAPLDTNTTAPFTAGTYQANLARYIDEVREQGATPILITALPRLVYGDDGQLSETHGGYIHAMKDVAAAKDCLLIDLNNYAKTEISKLSQADAEKLYNSGDATHLSAQGAALFANYISDCIDSFKLPLSAYRLK